ncbi:XdhC family protein [Pseudomonas sp.]|uniref:XdhC family protein n=1 Tax=Pseudomonas sp. TaxID=306 RepID=UPI0026322913|nr:XdhC family protein [Pseudomonas sp.]
MDSLDLEVLKKCSQWLMEGLRCELVTVVKTWGSSPRPPGSSLAICEDGGVIGSVSGGCIENDLIANVRANGIFNLLPTKVRYGVTAEQAHSFGLPCGGTIELIIEPLHAGSGIDTLLNHLNEHQLVERTLNLKDGSVSLSTTTTVSFPTSDDGTFAMVFGPRWRLLIIGAGQLSRFLAQVAQGLDYHVTVCDPREEYRSGWSLPGVELVHAMPDDVVLDMRLDGRSAVIALTHDPKLDDLALMEALKSDAFYVGAIGSHLNNYRRRERLKEFDLTEQQIARLHGPVGLRIGSKTPAEIAISALAEMTAVKNNALLPH